MPLPLLAAAGISAGTGLLSGLFGGGDEPTRYTPRTYTLQDVINAGYKPYNAAQQKINNSKIVQNQMGFDQAGARMRAASAGYNTNQMLGTNDWTGQRNYINGLLNANQAADEKELEDKNALAKYIFGNNMQNQTQADYLNWKMQNEYNDDNFANRFLAGAGLGARTADLFTGVQKLSTGGKVEGNNIGDSVPTMLEPGEVVVNKEGASMADYVLGKINQAGLMKRAEEQRANESPNGINVNTEGTKDTYTLNEIQEINNKNPELYNKLIMLFRNGIIKIIP